MMSRYSPLHLLRLTACSFALAAFAPAVVSAAPAASSSTSTSEGTKAMSTNPRVKLQTNQGDMVITLDAAKAPKSVENFLTYVKEGFYNGTVFHRVIDGFMIQGGGFTADLAQKATDKAINNEADNGLKNTVGTIAMARTGDPNSATSQFFINTADNTFLNFKNKTPQGYGYAVFGKVTSGMDVVQQISKTPTATRGFHQNVPVKPVIIKRVTIGK